ncbi:hypothetical protein ES705_37230 [subsurface metagenome]
MHGFAACRQQGKKGGDNPYQCHGDAGFGVGDYQSNYRDKDAGIDAEVEGVGDGFAGLGIMGGGGSGIALVDGQNLAEDEVEED